MATRASSGSSWWCGRWPRRPSTTRRTSASSTPSWATGTSATRWRAASRSCSPTGTTSTAPTSRPSQEGGGHPHQPHRRDLGADLGHGVPARRGGAAGADAIGADEIVALRAAIEGIKQRGHSDLGDKTLLDALVPAVDTLEERLAAGRPAPRSRARPRPPGRRPRPPGRCSPSGAARPTRASAASGPRTPAPIGVAVMFERLARPGRISDGLSPADQRTHDKGGAVKKFVNDPQGFRARDAQGHRPGQPGHHQVRARVQPDHADRRAPRRQGVDRPGLGLRS